MLLFKRSSVIAVALLFVIFIAFTGCKKEGTAERLGKKIDKAVEKAGEKLDNLKEDK
ncbi:MAG: transport-associated protein [Nitrospirota bacterium]|nr:transport-associated protein [Nitrospirota bacterium]